MKGDRSAEHRVQGQSQAVQPEHRSAPSHSQRGAGNRSGRLAVLRRGFSVRPQAAGLRSVAREQEREEGETEAAGRGQHPEGALPGEGGHQRSKNRWRKREAQ